ncbi:MAG: ATP synthase gamma chain [uncultured Solirubrobacteraceae bacterium]|uniref:ATP synthase gamma chain n=1 Tax=uncultured Solirubrobacteraceae bacterium TaxID=1162706 RepID=A0A6J4RVU6_9ACTN|nr:MAG: ATP synthase gamma chain [uncultured Solirubrobacteraceae bacterium]
MGAQLRVYRRRIRSVTSTKKITRAMELIAASRIVKAQQRVTAAQPYARQITRVISALASQSTVDHPLLQEQTDESRAAVLVITSDRGLAGGYNANALKTAAQLEELLRSEGKTPVAYLVGRKAVGYYRFRGRDIEQSWTGFSEQPTVEDAREVAEALIDAFLRTEEEGGVGEIHVVHTEYVSALTQRAVANRIIPLVVEESDAPPPEGALPLYEFEPDPAALLDALLPRFLTTRVYAAML